MTEKKKKQIHASLRLEHHSVGAFKQMLDRIRSGYGVHLTSTIYSLLLPTTY